MRVLFLSAYHAPSHRRWAQGVCSHLGEHEFDLYTQPPRNFPWRALGNSLSYSAELPAVEGEYEAILATSMVDLAGLRGLRPDVAAVPTLVYCHENQFAYPRRHTRPQGHLLLTNLYTLLAADRGLFNSEYNRRSFLAGAREFLGRMPDQVPDGVVERVEARAGVLPVGLEDELFEGGRARRGSGPVRILWNHRWEHDKAPERFFRALFALQESGAEFRVVVVGQQFRQAPAIFAEARERLKGRIDQWGWVEDRREYLGWLDRSDVVVSTAMHEFQGLAVQEAVIRGCLPLLPDRLAYSDFFDAPFLYRSSPDDEDREVADLVEVLGEWLGDPEGVRRRRRPDLEHLRWSRVKSGYAEELRDLVTAGR